MAIENKAERLQSILKGMDSVLTAYSGGVDSTFLAVTAHEVLGEKALAVFVDSPVITGEEREEAAALAQQFKLRFMVVNGNQMDDPEFTGNPPDRCYHCKRSILQQLKKIAEAEGISCIIEGTNADDTYDYRPGIRAVNESGAQSPLKEAGLTKEEIRRLSREKGLPTWDKPASPCLATRISYGTPVTFDTLKKIEQGERFLRNFTTRDLRLRHLGDTARIEVHPSEISVLVKEEIRREVVARLRELGYRYVTLDLEGYRSGSLNEGLTITKQED